MDGDRFAKRASLADAISRRLSAADARRAREQRVASGNRGDCHIGSTIEAATVDEPFASIICGVCGHRQYLSIEPTAAESIAETDRQLSWNVEGGANNPISDDSRIEGLHRRRCAEEE